MPEAELDRPVRDFISPATTALRTDWTVAQALAELRKRQIDQPIVYFYAIDDQQRLRGVVPTRRLLLSDHAQRIEEAMDKAISIPDGITLGEAMEFFAMHRLLALPVVDSQNRLLGVVDVRLYAEEAMDLAEQRRQSDIFQFIGLSLSEARQRRAGVHFRLRMPWLMCNLASGLVCAVIAAAYRPVLEQVLMLAMFIPLVLTLSEAVSMQSMTMTLPLLHAGPHLPPVRARAAVEGRTALLLGLWCGLLVAGVALLWRQGYAPALAIGASILIAMAAAAMIGMGMPILLHALRLDPKVAAGPVVLTLADVVTTAIYLTIATWWLL